MTLEKQIRIAANLCEGDYLKDGKLMMPQEAVHMGHNHSWTDEAKPTKLQAKALEFLAELKKKGD